MQQTDFVNGLLDFIQCLPTPFHAVQTMVSVLEDAGFRRLLETESWDMQQLQVGQRCFVTRNDSSIIAFTLHQSLPEHGIRMVGAHTDSPCLRVKPNPEITSNNYLQLGVEVYGGALLNPWFDRDLSLAGRVSYLNADHVIAHQLINLEKAVAIIPSLAIHLDRKANDQRTINKQTDLPPVLMNLPSNSEGSEINLNALLLDLVNKQLAASHADCTAAVKVLDYELSFYDVQPPARMGLNDDFIASARLDNLLSCYTGLIALLDSQGDGNALLVCNDHEEVGSVSTVGAQGTFLTSVLSRLCRNDEYLSRMLAASLMISVDNAHAVHPNYADKHEPNHGSIINHGPVIKINANQRYASNSETSALFRHLCDTVDVPVQSFVVRSDMGCGSTIGPITANQLGVRTVDVGVPTLAMHSIRELAGSMDAYDLHRVLREYFS